MTEKKRRYWQPLIDEVKAVLEAHGLCPDRSERAALDTVVYFNKKNIINGNIYRQRLEAGKLPIGVRL